MGLCSPMMARQCSMSAVTWFLNWCRLITFNYVDDFISISPWTLAMSHFLKLGVLLHQPGLQESVAKSCPPSQVMTCLGVELHTLYFTLSVDSAC